MPWVWHSPCFIFAVIAFLNFTVVIGNPEPAFTTANPASNVCPAGFDFVNGECRGFVQQLECSDNDAIYKNIDVCNGLRGTPPLVKNAEEHNYWSTRPRLFSNSNYGLAIGIICNTTSGEWIWSDGSMIEYRPPQYDDILNYRCDSNGVWFYRTDIQTGWKYEVSNNVERWDLYCITEPKKPEIREDGCINFEESDSMCYQVSEDAEDWSDAQNTCKSIGANLASIHSDQENSFIRRLAVSQGYVDGLLLGATISGKAKKFEWVDGSEWNYTNFIPGFPDDGFGDCLVMDSADKSGRWANSDCARKLPYVCSRKPIIYVPSDTCPGANVKEDTIVSTPGFPTNSTTFCDFFLKADVGKLVEVEVIFLDANPCCDYFILEEGSFGGNVIANLTGSIRGATFRTHSSNLMRASWEPSGEDNVMGAIFTFRGVLHSED